MCDHAHLYCRLVPVHTVVVVDNGGGGIGAQ